MVGRARITDLHNISEHFAILPKYAHMPIWDKNMAKWDIPEKSIKNVAQGC